MLERLLPRVIDNRYRGPKAALWLLGLLAAIRITMSLNSILNGAFVLTAADGVPLQTYPADASGTIVAIFALRSWGQLLLALLAVLTLVRYRSMTSAVFALLLCEYAGRKLILQFLPIIRSGTPPASAINTTLFALMIVGLLLSLWRIGGKSDRKT